MDNDIYDPITDYQDWYHSPRPAGGTVGMERLTWAGKQNQIKELIKTLKEMIK